MSPITIRRARAGNAAALRTLVDLLRPRITKMAAHYSRQCGEDADDLLQEAWLGLLHALEDVDPGIGEADQFLMKHAKWRMLDAVKRWHRHRPGAILCDAPDTAAACCGWAEAESELDAALFLEKLTPSQQCVLRRLILGQTWREAGRSLGCSSANIAYYVRKIRRSYADWLEVR